jgi:inosine/xanthosine triphosphatase
MWDVAVGSTNPTKVSAVRVVFSRLELPRLAVLAVPSGVREQPLGIAETRAGAENRAHRARTTSGARYGVGLEGGVDLWPDGSAWLTGVAAVETDDGRLLWALGPQMRLPPPAAEALAAGGELGPIIDGLSGLQEAKAGIGAIGWLTGGLVPRQQSWIVALACAVAPLFHPDLYAQEGRGDGRP